MQTTIRLSEEEWVKLKNWSAQRRTSASQLIRECIEHSVEVEKLIQALRSGEPSTSVGFPS